MADLAVVESERLSRQAVDETGKKISGNLHSESSTKDQTIISSTNYRRPAYTQYTPHHISELRSPNIIWAFL